MKNARTLGILQGGKGSLSIAVKTGKYFLYPRHRKP